MLLCKKIKLEVSPQDAATLIGQISFQTRQMQKEIAALPASLEGLSTGGATQTTQAARLSAQSLSSDRGRLAERAVVIGDLSQQQMVLKTQEGETPTERRKRQIRNRLVYNDWGLYSFVQMLTYKCLRAGKALHTISERGTSKTCHRCGNQQAMPLYKRTYRCTNCGLVMDRDDNSAINQYQRFVAGLWPHTLSGECGVLWDDTNSGEVLEASCFVQAQQLELWTSVAHA